MSYITVFVISFPNSVYQVPDLERDTYWCSVLWNMNIVQAKIRTKICDTHTKIKKGCKERSLELWQVVDIEIQVENCLLT